MTAHFPRPKTVSLSAWRTHSQRSMPGRASAPRGESREPPRWRVRGRRRQGWGVQSGGRPHKGTGGTQGPAANTQRRRLRSEWTDPAAGVGGAQKHTHPLSAHGGRSDCRCALLRLGRQAQDKAHDKGTGPRGPVMAVPGRQTPCVKAGKCVKHSCKVKNKT